MVRRILFNAFFEGEVSFDARCLLSNDSPTLSDLQFFLVSSISCKRCRLFSREASSSSSEEEEEEEEEEDDVSSSEEYSPSPFLSLLQASSMFSWASSTWPELMAL